MKKLKKFGYPIGWSDHTKDIASSAAVALGTIVIEKHIALDNNMAGPDHKASMNIKNLKKFTDIHDVFTVFKLKIESFATKENLVKKLAKKSLYYS